MTSYSGGSGYIYAGDLAKCSVCGRRNCVPTRMGNEVCSSCAKDREIARLKAELARLTAEESSAHGTGE